METKATGPTPITPVGWPGLPLTRLVLVSRSTHRDLQLRESLLVLHETGGAEIEVRRGDFAWKFSAQAGNFDFYPAGRYEALDCDGPAKQFLLVTLPASFERLVSQEGRWDFPLAPRFQFHDHRLLHLVHAILERSAQPHAGPDEIALSLALADRLLEIMAPPPPGDGTIRFSPLLRRLITEHLDRHLALPAEVERVARLSGLARTQFSSAFRAAFGMPPHHYVVERRITLAKRQLLAPEVSLTELAHRLGFASHAHFSTVFKSRVGVTPSQFRQDSGAQLPAGPA